MVNLDISRGAEVVSALDRANVKISVALLAFLSEFEDWRLVLSARQFDALGIRGGYRLLDDSLTAAGITLAKAPPVMILAMTDPTIKDLRRYFAKTKSVDGMRLGGQTFGDRFVQDAYVYRIT